MTRLIPALATLMLTAAPALADRVAVLVFDASGSMWNRVEGDLTRIEVARDVMGDYFASRDGAVPLSVIAYGHNRRGDCRDIEVINPMRQGDVGSLESRLRGLMPRGMTPLTDSLAMARDQIPPTAEAADIILVTDGLENCAGDPCALAASLAAEGIDIRAHVVGFGLSAVEVETLSCITDQTGGMLFQTNSGAELADALQQVSVAEPAPAPEPAAAPESPEMLMHYFVFRDTGTGTPRGLMEWRAEAPDGTILSLGTTEGTLQSLEGVSASLPVGEWLIVAEGAEGRAERLMNLTQCCGRHGIPFTGTEMVAVIPPISPVQAGMEARIPYEITHPGTSNLGGTPYKIIATGPEGSLTRDQVVRDDLITGREPGLRGGATGKLALGTYRLVVAITRNGRYDIIAEQSFDVVSDPVVTIIGPDYALPGERVQVGFDGGYATSYYVEVVDQDDRSIGQGNALFRGPGGALTMEVVMPTREGVFDMVVRRDGEIISRRPITISATPPAAQGADTLPAVPAIFRLPPDVPQSDVTWDAVPLDPDMSPEAWAPMDTGPVVSGRFEPGNWRVTAYAPGEVTLSADVAIFPGQVNDFTLSLTPVNEEDHGSVLRLEGDWRLLAIPPYDAPPGTPAEPIEMMRLTLIQQEDGFGGRFTPSAAMTGPQAAPLASDLDRVTDEDGTLFLEFAIPPLSPEPFRLSLGPLEGEGWAGTMSSGGNAVPVMFWRDTVPLPGVPDLQLALYGPAPQTGPDKAEIVARCDTPGGCPVTQGRLTVTLPQGWAMTEPLFFSAVGDGLPTDLPMMSFHGPAPDEALQLNPHQWLQSNGPCVGTGAGPLCWFFDAAPGTAAAAQAIAPTLQVAEDHASVDGAGPATPAAGLSQPCDLTACRVTLAQAGLVAELPQGWWVRKSGREEGAARAQFTNGADLIVLTGAEDWSLENGPCHDSAAGPVCFWGSTGDAVDIAAAFIAQSLSLLPAAAVDGPADDALVDLGGSVTLAPMAGDILAGTGGYFPIDLAAPEGFQGRISLHAPDGVEIFQEDAASFLGAQDQVLPVPDTPGLYEARIHDATGRLRATTGIQVMIDDRPATIRVRLSAETQFGSGCMIGAELAMPGGPRFAFNASLQAVRDDDGAPVPPLPNSDAPVSLEITGFDGRGATLAPLAFAAPCEAMILRVGAATCAMGEDVAGDCPLPITYVAPPALLGLFLSGSDQLEMAADPTDTDLLQRHEGRPTPGDSLVLGTATPLDPPLAVPAEEEPASARELTAEEIDDLIWTLTEGAE